MANRSDNSLRNFPVDMLVSSGLPLVVAALFASWVFEAFYNHPLCVLAVALLTSILGAALLFWAKLPLYRRRIYFSFGPRAILPTQRGLYYWGIGLALGGCFVMKLLLVGLK